MALVQFPAWQPDVADYQGQTTKTANNVMPRGDGYGPFLALLALSSALPGPCRGAFFAVKDDGSIVVFAATASKLYKLDNSLFGWVDVSKGGLSYSSIPSSEQWQFTQFNNFVVAAMVNTVLQVFDLNSSTAFDDLAGSPPQCRYITTINRFLVASGLLSQPFRLQWSGLNDTTNWSPGVNSSDYQDLPDGGVVRGVAGGETGLAFQDYAIRRMTFAHGAPYVFQIDRVTQDKGLYAPYSLIRAGDQVFFLSASGFNYMVPTGLPKPLGKERFDRTFFTDLDRANLQLVLGASDPRNTRVFWSYKSVNGASGLFDKIICYDWVLDRATIITSSGQFITGVAQPGVTLESLDAISGSLDALTASLDSYATAISPEIAAFDSSNRIGFYRGAALEATIDTTEIGTAGARIDVKGFRPVTDAPTVFGSASSREISSDTATFSAEAAKNSWGQIPLRVNTRYSRLRSRIPAGTSWTFAAGVEPDIS